MFRNLFTRKNVAEIADSRRFASDRAIARTLAYWESEGRLEASAMRRAESLAIVTRKGM